MSAVRSSFAARDRHRHELAERVRVGCAQAELLAVTADVLRDDVGYDAAFLSATDPSTTLLAGAGLVDGLPPSICAPWLENEFAHDDFAKFTDLHRTGVGATTLRRATFGRPVRSARHRDVLDPVDLGPELRVTLSVDGDCWGVVALYRRRGAEDFDDTALETVNGLVSVVARGLRAAVLRAGASAVEGGLGVVVLDGAGRVTSLNDRARALLGDLGQPTVTRAGSAAVHGEVYAVAARARAWAEGMGGPPPVVRLGTDAGHWLTLRGETTHDARGAVVSTVVVVEPSRTTDVLPLVVAAHELTEREAAVLAELVRGASTDEVARALTISPHTVRDHVKSLFGKVGVRSRGQLVSQLYGLHLAPGLEVAHRA